MARHRRFQKRVHKKHKKEMKEYDKRWATTYKKCNKQRRKKKNTLAKPKQIN